MMKTPAIFCLVFGLSCAAAAPPAPKTLGDVHAVVNKYVLPTDTRLALEQAIRESSRTELHTFKKHGQFLIVYADLRNRTYPHGIRSPSGGNGPNFVFLIDGDDPILVYRNGDAVENRIELIEAGETILLYSYCHVGLASGPPGRNRYRWDGAKFVYMD